MLIPTFYHKHLYSFGRKKECRKYEMRSHDVSSVGSMKCRNSNSFIFLSQEMQVIVQKIRQRTTASALQNEKSACAWESWSISSNRQRSISEVSCYFEWLLVNRFKCTIKTFFIRNTKEISKPNNLETLESRWIIVPARGSVVSTYSEYDS